MGEGVYELLEMLYNMVSGAWGLPLGADKCVIEKDKVLDLLDEIKAHLPAEIEEAKRLVAARNDFIASAKREAETIRKVAEERAKQMIDEQEIVVQAKQRANRIITEAEGRATELKRVANDYANDALRRTEEAIGEALAEVRDSRTRFNNVSAAARMKAEEQQYVDDGMVE